MPSDELEKPPVPTTLPPDTNGLIKLLLERYKLTPPDTSALADERYRLAYAERVGWYKLVQSLAAQWAKQQASAEDNK